MTYPFSRRTLIAATTLGLAAGATIPAHAADDDKAPAGTNSVDTIIKDMTDPNDRYAGDYGSGSGPIIVMGNVPRGTNTPEWWYGELVNPEIYHTSAWWNAVTPWVVVQAADGHAATNTRVRLSQIRLHLLSRSTYKWHHAQTTIISGQQYTPGAERPGPDDPGIERSGPGNSTEVKPPQNRSEGNYHGWGDLMDFSAVKIDHALYPADIRAVHVSVDAKLVVDNPDLPDDRERAQFIIHVGADYYPNTSVRAGQDPGLLLKNNASWLPGVGNSCNRLVTTSWTTLNFATLSATVKQEPGGGISNDELRQNPPPLN